MINKLRKKIFLIIFLAISLPLLLILIPYTISYYNGIIRSNTEFIERFFEPKGGPENRKDNQLDNTLMDGVYSIVIENDTIIDSSSSTTDDIKEMALAVSNRRSEVGIIGNYIYKVKPQKFKDLHTTIILIESKDAINKIKLVMIVSILGFAIGIVFIYILSKKIAKIIVKPVEETFSKQIDFISDASHELKTPLAVIQANSDVLENEIGDNKWLSYIQNEIGNMSKLIDELLLLTKIENVDKLRDPERFNISDHIELVVSSFESMAFEKKVKIESDIQKDVTIDKFNRDDITHILSTLIDNAIKHTDEKKKVIIEFLKNKDNIEIVVKNQGVEIPECERDKIFDRFYRVDKSRNRNEKRYGLGLAIAKSTVLKNNGTIKVDYKDGYTLFSVRLPI